MSPVVFHFSLFHATRYRLLPTFSRPINYLGSSCTGQWSNDLPYRHARGQIWIQVDAPSLVRIAYSLADDTDSLHWTSPVETNNSQANTAVLTLDKVEPGLSYNYRVELNGEIVTRPAKFTSPANYHGRTPPLILK